MPQRLDERPVGDALAVGDAARQRHVGVVPDPGQELADQSRLPDPRGPEHGDHLAAPGVHRPSEGVVQSAILLCPSDQRHVCASPPAVHGVEHSHQAVCPHRLGLALGHHVRNRLDLDRVPDQDVRRLAEQTSPLPAACSRRAAVLTASPVANEPPARAAPVTTDPVLTPVRIASRTPSSGSSCSDSSATA